MRIAWFQGPKKPDTPSGNPDLPTRGVTCYRKTDLFGDLDRYWGTHEP